jgi:GntP family gluconate:H+ symporter
VVQEFGQLPSTAKAFTPIFLPIVLIGIGSVMNYLQYTGGTADFLLFLGSPVVALLIGVFAAFPLLPTWNEETLTGWIGDGLKDAAIILLLTGAGGAFGAVIKATAITDVIKGFAGDGNPGGAFILLMPFVVAAALKTAQGSTTAAMVITSALVAPMLAQAGIVSAVPLALVVMAIGAGAMTISHVNDSYFWVVTQFSGLKVTDAYKAHSMATLLQGIVAIVVTMVLWYAFV